MRRSRLFLLTLLVAAIAPAAASAACPTGPGPVWVDYAAYGIYTTPVARILARPGTVMGVQNEQWRDSYQARGADTTGWHMRLLKLVGTVKAPLPKSQVLAKIPSLVALAESMTTCDEPWLALNEMQAVQMSEPLSYAKRRFRENVLLLSRELHERGVRVLLFMPTIPYESTRYRSYWRELSSHAELIYEAFTFSSREVVKRGVAGGTRYLRLRWSDSMTRLRKFVVRPSQAGLIIPFWTRHAGSGREGLNDAAWFRLTRIKTRAATQVGVNHGLGTVWSWGWQTNAAIGEVDADKPRAACHYLNERDPALCDPSAL
jgi:hypothetical protein